jgi:DNA-binding NtrC family response regulator
MRVLILEDDRKMRSALRRTLAAIAEMEFVEAASVEEALPHADSVDLMLVDIRLSENANDRAGLFFLRALRLGPRPRIPVVIVSASDSVADIREAMRLGARDYVLKTDLAPLTDFVERCCSGEGSPLRLRVHGQGSGELLGHSPLMHTVRSLAGRAARCDEPVLVTGESGTGKELVARFIHGTSGRREEPLVAINCATIPANLFESTLFGHERGAFTGADRRHEGRFEVAGRGTVFLDELGEMPLELQAKLLRVLEDRSFVPVGGERERPFEARIIAATNVDLAERMKAGAFRRDLFYRLRVLAIKTPALRERGRADILELLRAFNARGARPVQFTQAALDWLANYPWPGNVRELSNFVRSAAVMTEGAVDVEQLKELIGPVEVTTPSGDGMAAVAETLIAGAAKGSKPAEAMMRTLREVALQKTGGNKTAAARLLGVDRRSFGKP